MSNKNNLGFTLLEMIIVVSIIGILASFFLINFHNSVVRARDNQRIDDITQVNLAIALYKDKFGEYPAKNDCIASWCGFYDNIWTTGKGIDWVPGLSPSFMNRLPVDPGPDSGTTEPHGRQYMYRTNAAGDEYKVIAHQPEDCERIKSEYPGLVDPQRNCWAIGYWSAGATNF